MRQNFKSRMLRSPSWITVLVLSLGASGWQPARSAEPAPFPGKRSTWNGFTRYDFEVDGKPVLVVAPQQPATGRPWVWHGEFFGHKPAPDIALLERGFHVAYMQVPDMLGSPRAVAHWDAFYQELTQRHGLAKKVALVGLSRGGLYCYNWAAANPDRVACIYGDAPVCDFKSWPGGKGKGLGSPRDWKLVLEQYGFQDDAEALAYDKNPVDQLQPLAEQRVPLLHVYGDADEVVPWEENTGLVAQRYRELGGSITLIAKPGVGHHPHGLEDSTPIVEFIVQHAARPAAIESPGRPLVVGHRGLLQSAPENTLAGFRACLAQRVGFEFDVRQTHDGQLVCLHDATLERTTGARGSLAELSLADLRRLDAGRLFDASFAGEPIPTIEEILKLLAEQGTDSTLAAVDMKDTGSGIEAAVVRLAEQHKVLDRLVFIGATIDSADVRARLRTASPKAHVAHLAAAPDQIDQALDDQHADWVYLRFLPKPADAARIHQAGKRIFLAGPLVAGKEPENWQQAAGLKVDAILTDYPIELQRQFRRPGR